MQHKTAFGAIAAVFATAGLLLSAAPASAQAVPLTPASCDTGVLSYPPGAGPGAATTSNANPRAGQTIIASVPNASFDPRTRVVVTLDNDVATLGTVPVNGSGAARISARIPSSVQPGVHIVIFTGSRNGIEQQIGICITTTAAGTPITGGVANPATNPDTAVPVVPVGNTPIGGGDEAPARPSALPFTGSAELVTVAGLGAALLIAGAGTVVVARRRRSEAPLAV